MTAIFIETPANAPERFPYLALEGVARDLLEDAGMALAAIKNARRAHEAGHTPVEMGDVFGPIESRLLEAKLLLRAPHRAAQDWTGGPDYEAGILDRQERSGRLD